MKSTTLLIVIDLFLQAYGKLKYIFLFNTDYPENQHIAKVISQIENELNGVARRSTKSVLRQRDYEGLSSLDFTEITEEMKLLCPTAFNILSAMIQFVNNEDKRTAPMAPIYSIMMFKRCHEMSRVQRVNTVLVAEGNASQEVSNNYEPLDLTAVFKTMRSFYRYLPLFSFINHSPNENHHIVILL